MNEDLMPYAIPVGLDRKQRRFLTGLRYGLDFVNLAYGDLVDNALDLFDPCQGETLNNDCSRSLRTKMFFDAWAIVDNINRLRRLMHFGDMAFEDTITGFLDATEDFREHRNLMQHPDRDYSQDDDQIAASKILGTLLWVDYRMFDNTAKSTIAVVCQIHAGPNATAQKVTDAQVTVNRFPDAAAGNFKLLVYGKEVDLSRAHALANRAVERLGEAHEEAFARVVYEQSLAGTPVPESSLQRLQPDLSASHVIQVRFEGN